MERLGKFYVAPDPLQDLFGEAESRMVVPPQAFDPDVDFDINQAPELADQFLRSVDYRHNPLLFKPEQIIKNGFEGIPYRYPSI